MIDDDEAVKRAVRAFYAGAGFDTMEKATGKKVKHNKDFFDNYEKELRKSVKKPKGEAIDETEIEAEDVE